MMRTSKLKRNVLTAAVFALMLVGSVFLLGPIVGNLVFQRDASARIYQVEQLRDLAASDACEGGDSAASAGSAGDGVDSRSLLEERRWLEEYNHEVAAGQRVLAADSFDFEKAQEWTEGGFASDGLVGVIEIPAMDCTLPLYLGSSCDHMAKGATVVEGSSAPLGGASTNCVIAAHRGWNQTAMFRDIERLSVGDEVTLRTLWQDLRYTVVGTTVISPSDTQAVRVRENLDLVTLVTCHPYGYNYQRYAVFCMRSDSGAVAANEGDENADIFSNDMATTQGEGRMLETVLGNPMFEDVLRVIGVALLIVSSCCAASRLWGRR